MTKAFADKKTVFHGQKNSDGKKPDLEKAKYADAPFVDTDDGKTLEDVKKKFAPNADKPTSASADKDQKKLPELMQKIDPEGKAQILPEMYKQMMKLRNVLNAGAASAGGGGGGGGGQPNSQGNAGEGNETVNPILEDALAAAFVNMSKRFGFEYTVEVILGALNDGGIDKINTLYKEVVIDAVIIFLKMAIYYGPNDIPVSTYPPVPAATPSTTPSSVVDISDVPLLYVREWYALETNPYPAFIEWESSDGATTIYTKNTSTYYFDSSTQEIFYNTETSLTADLLPYFSDKNLTATALNTILSKYALVIEQYNIDSSLGNGAGSGISQNQSQNQNQGGGGGGGGGGGAGGIGQMMGMLQGMLGGQLKQHMTNILEKQLPNSVNDQQKVKKNVQLMTQDMANNKKGFDAIQKMFGMGSGGMMGGMNLQGMMSGLMSGGGGGGGGGMPAGGGSSGGGGGGAGSGVPSGQGSYTGGDVSDEGMAQIQSLLTLLGMK